MERLKGVQIKEKMDEHRMWLDGDTTQGKQADFSGRLIKIANFKAAKLSNADFTGSTLRIIEFVDADLRDSDFENTELYKVDFHDAKLTGANFKGAMFQKVHFNEDFYDQVKEDLTEEQRKGIITSYKKFMRKMIF